MHSLYRFSRLYVIKRKAANLSSINRAWIEFSKDFNKMRMSSSAIKTEEQHAEADSSCKNTNTEALNDGISKPVFSNSTVDNTTPKISFIDSEEYVIEETPVVKKERNPFYNIELDCKDYDASDVPHFIDDIEPALPASFNLAAYVNRSSTLKKLVELGVDLSEVEQKAEQAKFIVNLDFDRDIKPYIQFLNDKGVPTEEMGLILTRNPMLLKQDLENLQIRINYLKSKKFNDDAIARIITKNAFHLMHDTKQVDRRLGFFQKTFSLSGEEVRFLITKCPKLVSYHYDKIMERIFVFKEEMGFSNSELKQLLLMKPKVWFLGRKNIENRFEIIHNMMGLTHDQILQYPGILLKRGFLLEQRHKYLVHLGRAQYDQTKPGYVSIKDIATTTDNAFCRICTKTSVAEYNDFLKTI